MINHASMFYAFGYNQYNIGKNYETIHAEHHAINKLKFSKKKKKVNVIVFRICNLGEDILCAKPCYNCQIRLKRDIEKKGYSLNRVYYTETNCDEFNFIKKSELFSLNNKIL